MSVEKGNWFENQREVEQRLMTSVKATYSVETPDGGVSRTFDPDDCTLQDIADFLATLAKDIMG